MAEFCYENNLQYGELLGTAFVARDMLRIAETLDDDGLLRYWGKICCFSAQFVMCYPNFAVGVLLIFAPCISSLLSKTHD